MYVFGDFKVHHKNWLTYSGGTDRPGKLCYSFTNISGFHTSFTECEFSLESNAPDILALRETNLDDSCNFSVGGWSAWDYLPLIRKDPATYVDGLAVFVKKGSPFAQDFSRNL